MAAETENGHSKEIRRKKYAKKPPNNSNKLTGSQANKQIHLS